MLHSRTFFIVYDEKNPVSFGTLRPILLSYTDQGVEKSIEILGIQAVASIIEGKGYGRILIRSMITYVKEANKTLVGFCLPKNRDFYRKCGLNIWPDGNEHFYHIKKDGSKENDTGDVIYVEFDDTFIENAISKGLEIHHFVSHW